MSITNEALRYVGSAALLALLPGVGGMAASISIIAIGVFKCAAAALFAPPLVPAALYQTS